MHKKRVGEKYYYYTTVREGLKTKSIYLGSTRNKAITKEKQLKKGIIKVTSKHSFKNYLLCFGIFLIITLLFFGTMIYFKGLNITGRSVMDVNLELSSNAYMVIDGVIIELPISMIKNKYGGWYYNLYELDLTYLDLSKGRHLIEIYDSHKLVYSDVLIVE
ncbi:MAG TPA: hypothetical protein VJB89_00275 [Candidatus Nanoarchaeia archaeon]|nr:hypothetical protein [Candidatus Nanoarchaeia archaeon]